MNYYQKLIYGNSTEANWCREDLVFLKPVYGNKTKDEKCVKSIEDWAFPSHRGDVLKEGWEIKNLDNIPISGYTVDGYSSRGKTDNKHIYIKHPNGICFEITVENFTHQLLPYVHIKEGVIQDECVIVQIGQKLGLVAINSKAYKGVSDTSKPKIKLSDLEVGDSINCGYSLKTYLGKHKIQLEFNNLTTRIINIHLFSNGREIDKSLPSAYLNQLIKSDITQEEVGGLLRKQKISWFSILNYDDYKSLRGWIFI